MTKIIWNCLNLSKTCSGLKPDGTCKHDSKCCIFQSEKLTFEKPTSKQNA